MIVRAKHWLKIGAEWKPTGAEFDVNERDYDAMSGMVEIVSDEPQKISVVETQPALSETIDSVQPELEEPGPAPETQKKRGRKKNT